MITEDYILKIIRLAAEFIAKALKLSKEGDFLTSEKTLENGLKDLTGISIETIRKLDADALKDMVGGDEPSIFILARVLETLAEIEQQKGMLDLHYIYLMKSLELYLSITNTEDYETEKPILEIYPMVREVLYDRELISSLIDFFKKIDNAEEANFLGQLMDS
jgi:hypothetical protein